MEKPKKIYTVNVNLFFREGLDLEKHAKELKALGEAAQALQTVALEQFSGDVEGQEAGEGPYGCVWEGNSPRNPFGDQEGWRFHVPRRT